MTDFKVRDVVRVKREYSVNDARRMSIPYNKSYTISGVMPFHGLPGGQNQLITLMPYAEDRWFGAEWFELANAVALPQPFKLLESLQGHGAQALLLIDMLVDGQLTVDSAAFRVYRGKLNKEYGELYRQFCTIATAEPQPTKQIQIWRFADAPDEFKALSDHGGDEDWVALVPETEVFSTLVNAFFGDPFISDVRNPFGVSEISRHTLPNGALVFIGAHA